MLTVPERGEDLSLNLHNSRATDRGSHEKQVTPQPIPRMVVLVYFKVREG
jgi:hypothetical protein